MICNFYIYSIVVKHTNTHKVISRVVFVITRHTRTHKSQQGNNGTLCTDNFIVYRVWHVRINFSSSLVLLQVESQMYHDEHHTHMKREMSESWAASWKGKKHFLHCILQKYIFPSMSKYNAPRTSRITMIIIAILYVREWDCEEASLKIYTNVRYALILNYIVSSLVNVLQLFDKLWKLHSC